MVDDRSHSNGSLLPLPNGIIPHTHQNGVAPFAADGDHAVHEGFATIRSGGGKRGRARSSPLVTSEPRPKTCPACCGAGGPLMEPLWEERHAGVPIDTQTSTVARRESKIPWWEVATRRSRYRSCPAFSQASIVSALEQTVSDVTDKLERLASSPDLKVAEADELRRSAAILRRQSSAVSQSVSSGYFSLERQASCDSVSSATSSISNATHVSFNSVTSRIPLHQHCPNDLNHNLNPNGEDQSPDQVKIKKRNWFRASFRRAFGRPGRKRNKPNDSQAVPNNWESISNCGHLKSHNYPTQLNNRDLQQQQQQQQQQHYHSCHTLHRNRQVSVIERCKGHKNIIKDSLKESEAVGRLQRLLLERERALSESRLELSAAQTTLKTQAEVITRLQTEVATLKEENMRLNSLVQTKFGSITDTNLSPLIDNFNLLTISNSNGTYATINHIKGKKLKLVVVENTNLEKLTSSSDLSFDSHDSILVGTVSIVPKTTWEELDNTIAETFEKYCSRLDPGNGLGVGRESMYCYRVAEALRGEGLPKPDLLPYGYCVGSVDKLCLWLKGPLQKDTEYPHGNVSSISFQNGIPSLTLKHLTSLLHETRRIVVVGPPSCGQSDIAHQLARSFVASRGLTIDNHSIVTFNVSGSNSLELCQLLASIWPSSRLLSESQENCVTENRSSVSSLDPPPEIMIINDIHGASGVVETLQKCLPANVQNGPAIIATSQNAPILVTRLQIHCLFRWVGFTVQEEPIRGALSRLLRRPVLAAEITSGISLPVVHRTVDWLMQLWFHLNSLLAADAALGPLLLADCPVDQEAARTWFLQKWNNVLVPTLREMLKEGNGTTTDPKDWVVSTFPWKSDVELINNLSSVNTSLVPKIPISSVFSSASQRLFQVHSVLHQTSNSESVHALPTNAKMTRPQGIIGGACVTVGSKCLSSTSSESDIYEKPTVIQSKIPMLGTFSTFVTKAVEREGMKKCKMETFTPVLYRKDLNSAACLLRKEMSAEAKLNLTNGICSTNVSKMNFSTLKQMDEEIIPTHLTNGLGHTEIAL